MTTTLLLILIPLAFVAGGFVAYKGVQLGLRWQIEVRQEKPPTLEVPNPVQPIIEHKQEKEQANIFNEWLNGEESR
jgi:hypothetical protein